jgi:DNA-binding CsgD family transcriptional regulator
MIMSAAIVMVFGISGIFLAERIGPAAYEPPYVIVLAIAICVGVGFALFNLCWAHIFSKLDPKRLYRLVILSYLFGLVMYLPVTFMPPITVVPVIICFVLLSTFLLTSVKTTSNTASADKITSDKTVLDKTAANTASADKTVLQTEERPRARKQAVKEAVRMLWRPVLCTAAFSFMSGLMLHLSGQSTLPLGEFQQVSIIASLIILAVLLLPALILSRPLDITSAYRISLPISAAGFLLLPFIWNALSGITNALVNMGLMTVSIVLWCMLAATAAHTRLPVHLVFAACLATITLANLAGMILGFLQGVFLTQSFLSLAAVALVSIYLLSMVSLIVFKRQEPARADGEKKAAESQGYREERYLESCQKLAQEAGFTPREAEMLPLLGSGRSIARIAKMLFISENTAKSHIKSIYSKLDVHSKQELIDLVSEKTSSQSATLTPDNDAQVEAVLNEWHE